MITKDSIESAYCFFHQKQRVYLYSTMEWQKDDIEWAIADYADNMDAELYALLADGRTDFLRDHKRFPADIDQAVAQLSQLMS